MNEQSIIPESYVFITLIIVLFGDLVFRLAWNKMYFTLGVPMFVMSFPVKTRYKGVPFQYLFEEEFGNVWPWRSFVFKTMDTHTIAFREQFLEVHRGYWPLMHGLLVFENQKKRVVVKGFANWFTLWLIINIALASANMSDFFTLHITDSIAFIALLFGLFYSFQCYRFLRVGKLAAKLCSSQHFLDKGEIK